MVISSSSELIGELFAPALTFAGELAVVDDCDDPAVAAHRHRLFTEAYMELSRGLQQLDQSELDLTPDLQNAVATIRTIKDDCRAHNISIGDAVLFFAKRRKQLAEAARTGWIAAKSGGALPPRLTVPDDTAFVGEQAARHSQAESEPQQAVPTTDAHPTPDIRAGDEGITTYSIGDDDKQKTGDNLEQLDKEIPAYAPASEDWVSNKVAASILGVKTKSLTNRRHEGTSGERGNERYGLHNQGLFWRSHGKEHPKYYLPLMKKHAGHLAKIHPKIDRKRLK